MSPNHATPASSNRCSRLRMRTSFWLRSVTLICCLPTCGRRRERRLPSKNSATATALSSLRPRNTSSPSSSPTLRSSSRSGASSRCRPTSPLSSWRCSSRLRPCKASWRLRPRKWWCRSPNAFRCSRRPAQRRARNCGKSGLGRGAAMPRRSRSQNYRATRLKMYPIRSSLPQSSHSKSTPRRSRSTLRQRSLSWRRRRWKLP